MSPGVAVPVELQRRGVIEAEYGYLLYAFSAGTEVSQKALAMPV